MTENNPIGSWCIRMRLYARLGGRPFLGALGAALIPILWIFIVHGREEIVHQRMVVTSLEALCYDLPFNIRAQGRRQSDVLLIEIEFNAGSDRLDRNRDRKVDRAVMAQALRRVTLLQPTLVVLDCLFSDSQPEADAELIAELEKLAAAVPVIVATSTRGESGQVHPSFLRPGVWPGLAEVDNRPWNTVRLLPGLFTRDGARPICWVAASALHPALGPEMLGSGSRWINYYGPDQTTFERIRLLDLLDLPAADLVQRRGRKVFLGLGPPDESFRSPIRGEELSGVAIHATAVQNLLDNDWLRRCPVGWQGAMLVAYACGLGLLLARLRGNGGRLLALGSAVALTLLAWASHWLTGFWWWWLIFDLQAVGAVLLGLFPTGYVAFISYKVSDGQVYANLLEQGLGQRGLRTYLAPGNITPGTSFEKDLYRRIRQAPLFLLVLSPHAREDLRQEDTWVSKEAALALQRRRCTRLIVVRPYSGIPGMPGLAAASVPEPVPPLRADELPGALTTLATLESVVMETGKDRAAALDRMCQLP